MEIIILIIAFVFAILQIILFFKIWGMTNDIRIMRDFFVYKKNINPVINTKQDISGKGEKSNEDNKKLDEYTEEDFVPLTTFTLKNLNKGDIVYSINFKIVGIFKGFDDDKCLVSFPGGKIASVFPNDLKIKKD